MSKQKGFKTMEKPLMDSNNSTDLYKALVNILTKLVNYFDEFTYFKSNEVIPFLLLSKNKYFKKILFGVNYEYDKDGNPIPTRELSITDLRKYEKGKFKDEVRDTIKDIVRVIAELGTNSSEIDENMGIFSKLFKRS